MVPLSDLFHCHTIVALLLPCCCCCSPVPLASCFCPPPHLLVCCCTLVDCCLGGGGCGGRVILSAATPSLLILCHTVVARLLPFASHCHSLPHPIIIACLLLRISWLLKWALLPWSMVPYGLTPPPSIWLAPAVGGIAHDPIIMRSHLERARTALRRR